MLNRCPVCENGALQMFLQRRNVPVHQNLLHASEASARAATRGDLEMTVCRDCGFVFNRAFDTALLRYGQGYENDQTCSPTFHAYVDGLVRMLVERDGVRGKTIVEVGCGPGYFLRRLIEADPGNRGIGFDPSYSGPLHDAGGRLEFRLEMYGPQSAAVRPEVVLCRHVIEHVEAPYTLVNSVRAALAGAPSARVFFETPCVEWILRNEVIWDFFYEHCSLFSAGSLRFLFERCGFANVKVSHLFGDQYLWLQATLGETSPSPNAGEIPALCGAYAATAEKRVAAWRATAEQLRRLGPVAVWGAGAKGVTFVNLVDPQREIIDCLVDLNPNKVGRFVAGSCHPIVDYRALDERGVKNAILMNPNYEAENRALIAEAGLDVELIKEVLECV